MRSDTGHKEDDVSFYSEDLLKIIDDVASKVATQFPTFGGGRGSDWNPIAEALKDRSPSFAAGVDVRSVVVFVIGESMEDLFNILVKNARERQEHGTQDA